LEAEMFARRDIEADRAKPPHRRPRDPRHHRSPVGSAWCSSPTSSLPRSTICWVSADGAPPRSRWSTRLERVAGYCIRQRLGRLDEALVNHTEAHDLAVEIGDRSVEAYALNNMGNIHRLAGRLTNAAQYQRRARRIADHVADCQRHAC
jgi:hypothetical protein